MNESNKIPPFTLNGSPYDQSTYVGRFQGFLDVIDPRCLFISDKELDDSIGLLEKFKTNQLPKGVTDEQLWHARKVRDAVVHPATGEHIFPLFRMAAFVPINVPLVAGMLGSTGIAGTLFWQWANQSYNSALNYANRSGSDISMEEIGTSYGIAVGTSLSLAMTFRWLGKNGPKVVRRVASIPFVVPYIAVASAGAANVYFSRRPEMQLGVPVVTEFGTEMGISKEAARLGVMQTILSRSLGLPVPVLILPTIIMKAVPKSIGPRGLMFAELTAITAALCIALPGAIAIFPQRLEINATSLEPEFHNLVDEQGKPITKLYSNKGL
mmetsp:Transcript_7991/g.9496  ORF Transcript_7991/g.9496 Transcript_7991/m.9496 type:complete len:325 (+) Transcript_7991:138-1112(+)|eukprot:CAMPEP_0204831068 /NCGR_PEP_ID=MMETSP1346-20131115/9768_1 /ASSEMBLY_ACC=CAM_ASM_000771 /TAXON_ID=215587 /ORGANISM="Aplanochytrium stocchinoi, Strain GSBS06" /LENGTH=324 /DNA_ID=CAMNT_0051961783 /DNA_START=88 /DNA_END=1062 /DNA_ORIENTATION=-